MGCARHARCGRRGDVLVVSAAPAASGSRRLTLHLDAALDIVRGQRRPGGGYFRAHEATGANDGSGLTDDIDDDANDDSDDWT